MNGTIRWFARHRVAANLTMGLVLLGGLLTVGVSIPDTGLGARVRAVLPAPLLALLESGIKQEVFPEFSLDLITITVPYLGAAPQEVEEGVCVRIEEAIQGLDGVKEVVSVASEGVGVVTVKLDLAADARVVLEDIKTRVDGIDTFPEEAEKPVVREVTNRRQVIDVAISGDVDERSLRELADRVRDEIATLPGITLTELANSRPFEIAIEVSERELRRYGLTFDEVASAVRRSSIDLPGGAIKTTGGEILLRTKGQAYRGPEFEALVLLTRPDGTHLRLGDVARVDDGFAETDQSSRFDGKPAMLVQVFRVGEQDALSIAAGVQKYILQAQSEMPEGVTLTTWNDASRILRDRRNLLIRNGASGLALILVILALFLRFRLALWIAVGLVIAFTGTLWVMPALGVSINLISLFAFILVLGIVVDDAIIVGESIHTSQHEMDLGLEGAIEGAVRVGRPVVFAVLTTVAAFMPLLNVEGATGKVMRTIPLIVIPCLLWSLVESLWILPAHLSHYVPRSRRSRGKPGLWLRFQARFASGVEAFVARFYRPTLELALRWRYATLAIGISTLLLTAGLVGGGFISFVFFPNVESDFISAAITLPPGTPADVTSQAVRQLEDSAARVRREIENETGEDAFRHMVAAIGEHPFQRAQQQNAGGAQAREVFSHLGELTVELVPAEDRTVSGEEIVKRWRRDTGPIADAIDVTFTASLFSPGDDVDVQLTGPDIDELRGIAEQVKLKLAGYAGVYEIADSFRAGKQELELSIKPAAEILGLTQADLGRQVRQAFYGEEAQRIQRGREDVRVMVRYPRSERGSVGDLENQRIRTPDGREVPFSEVAQVRSGRGYATIKRIDRRRAINVTADVDAAQTAPGVIIADLRQKILPDVLREHPRVTYSFEGQQAEQRDTMSGLLRGFVLALIVIYALLAIPLRSYVQPLVIMSAIPFGLVGAVWGHALIGLDLTILSMFGLVALTGVVVNDSLVMVDFINRHRETRENLLAAVRQAGTARFRAILLTSLTTFFGLVPLMLERSMQARFLIPMAVSLAFGVMFATFITLILIPSGYMIMEDLLQWLSGRRGHEPSRSDTGELPVRADAEPI